MKRIISILILATVLCTNTSAQPSQRQKMIHMAAVRIAAQIEVKESDKAAFISLYQSFKKESAEIMKVQPAENDDKEKAAEAKILSDFEKSDRLLNLRRTYYPRFRKILSPSQIQKMYDAERKSVTSSRAE